MLADVAHCTACFFFFFFNFVVFLGREETYVVASFGEENMYTMFGLKEKEKKRNLMKVNLFFLVRENESERT